MSKEYIPVTTADTLYFKPKTQAEMENMIHMMNVGDMIFSKWTFSRGMWYTMGLNDEADPTTKCLFPNIVMSDKPKPLRRWERHGWNFCKTKNHSRQCNSEILNYSNIVPKLTNKPK
ncbi:MAG: hypothetical protein FWB96_07995 [Defluviitaleaceae bacterium]|nr:hypothetical protein [Defluviitaleaceae bacterium]MCL2262853.1 hypothetical protein [Defluviitaleaceae bacterium]